ncbi:Zn-dependent exopeptidase [Umbelopsis sp. PMI_123]|nr:Zn-dependent exopeptidase [Umbelopsis sp. PMI_123]
MLWLDLCKALAIAWLVPVESAPLQQRASNVSLQNPELFAFHRAMMAIDSTSGHETDMTDFVANHLRSLNWTVELQPVHNPTLDPNIRRENIYAYLGSNRTTRLLINSHTDTVPPFYPPTEDDENVYGRGANDAKGQIAVQLFALERLRKENKIKEGDVAILWDVGEEEYADGIMAANSFNITPIWSITGEPTESYQATGHKGGFSVYLNSTGLAAHSSVPQLGRNAIVQLIEAYNQVVNDKFAADSFWVNTTISLDKIQGGLVPNQVPDNAIGTINVRNAADASLVLKELEHAFSKIPHVSIIRNSTMTNPIKFDVIKNWIPEKVMPYGTDLASWTGKNYRFLIGVGSINTAHTDHEVVSKAEMLQGVDYYAEFITGLLNGTFQIDHAGTFPSVVP